MDCTNQDVFGKNCVCNDAGELVLTEDKMKAWVEHYARLLNVEFEWPSSLKVVMEVDLPRTHGVILPTSTVLLCVFESFKGNNGTT